MWRLKIFRIFLIPFGLLAELFIGVLLKILEKGYPDKADKLLDWAITHIPSREWYVGS